MVRASETLSYLTRGLHLPPSLTNLRQRASGRQTVSLIELLKGDFTHTQPKEQKFS
jgi:hypothetical protein